MSYNCKTCGEELDIVTIIGHDCDEILEATELSRGERNTLMYIESRVVDHGGSLDHRQMNHEDMQNIKVFQALGMLDIYDFEVLDFTDRAFELTMECRKLRAAQNSDIIKTGGS